jgi:hypothetical protein
MEPIRIQAESLCIEVIADAFAVIEEQEVRVATILMPPIIFTNFKELTMEGGANVSIDLGWSADIDDESVKKENDVVEFFWGTEIKIDPMLPENKIILNSAKQFGSKSVELTIKQSMKRDLLWSIVKSE